MFLSPPFSSLGIITTFNCGTIYPSGRPVIRAPNQFTCVCVSNVEGYRSAQEIVLHTGGEFRRMGKKMKGAKVLRKLAAPRLKRSRDLPSASHNADALGG